MAVSLEPKIALAIVAAVAVSFAAYHTASVFAPLVLALFIIAIVWPLQQRLQSFLPTLVALAITIIVLVAISRNPQTLRLNSPLSLAQPFRPEI